MAGIGQCCHLTIRLTSRTGGRGNFTATPQSNQTSSISDKGKDQNKVITVIQASYKIQGPDKQVDLTNNTAGLKGQTKDALQKHSKQPRLLAVEIQTAECSDLKTEIVIPYTNLSLLDNLYPVMCVCT
jgi:hypothetical protein